MSRGENELTSFATFVTSQKNDLVFKSLISHLIDQKEPIAVCCCVLAVCAILQSQAIHGKEMGAASTVGGTGQEQATKAMGASLPKVCQSAR